MFKKKEKAEKGRAEAARSGRGAPAPKAPAFDPYTTAGKIRARIIDAEKGLQVLPSVYGIRIQSKDYSLLVMEDYMPALGKVEGTVTLLNKENELILDNIRGFYKHQHNEFTLLIEERLKPEASGKDNEGAK